MSDPCIVNFMKGDRVMAKIYQHWSGSPKGDDGMMEQLQRFFNDVETQTEWTRFSDPVYLSSKYIVWGSQRFREGTAPLDFYGLGILINDIDVNNYYSVHCDNAERPLVSVRSP